MQIRKLVIDNHKCLVDFSIQFQTIDGGSSTVLIGENGAGKTTMLDAVLEILMSFDSRAIENKIDYNYELEYLYAGNTISITGQERYYKIDVNHENICLGAIGTVRRQLLEYGQSIFPERIIAFYSGANDKSRRRFNRINIDYRSLCRKAVRQYRKAVVHGITYDGIFPKRKFNRCVEELTPIYLVSILGGEESFEKEYLQDYCHFGEIQNVTIALDFEKLAALFDVHDDRSLDPLLECLVEFLDARFVPLFRRGFLHRNQNEVYFELGNIAELGMDSIAIYDFFEKLQTLLAAEYSVHISVGESRVNCNDLSEGQRQLIKVLGMLGISKSEDCLVLMDEPDAHMNPRWKYELKKTIDRSLQGAVNTQAIIATHDPLVINGVEKEYIRIFVHNKTLAESNGFYFTQVIEPTEETAGMGIDGLLQSQYYGLKTSYDEKTSEKFVERQLLYVKLINNEITDDEKIRLKELTQELGAMPISYNTIDFLYDDFIKVFRDSPLYHKEYLTFDEIDQRRREIRRIIDALYEEQV